MSISRFSRRYARMMVAALLAGAAWLSLPRPALACASCGSGGDDPLILYPNERQKLYLGLAQSSGFRNFAPDGRQTTTGGPTAKQTLTVAFGYAFSPRAFATLTAPYQRNSLDGDAESAPGDASLATRYTPVLQTMANPWIPQVQLLAGYKHGAATSSLDSDEMKTLLDVFGTGFSEARAGIDVWYGMTAVKVGVAQTWSVPLARRFDDIEYQPGRIGRSTMSLGWMWLPTWKTTGGVTREERRELRIDGEEQADSSQLNHSAFLTTDWLVTPLDTVRLTYARQAALLARHNTNRANAVSMAYTRAL